MLSKPAFYRIGDQHHRRCVPPVVTSQLRLANPSRPPLCFRHLVRTFMNVLRETIVILPNAIFGDKQFESILIILWQKKKILNKCVPVISVPNNFRASSIDTRATVHVPVFADDALI